MNASTLLVLAILSLAFGNLSFGQTPEETNEPEPEATWSTAVSGSGADSGEAHSEETDEAKPPSPAEEAFQRALEHVQNKQFEEAISECTEAIRLSPENTEYLFSRAQMYYETRNVEKSFEDANKILGTDPNDLRARHLRGRLFEFSGKPDKALIEFNTAVERNPTSVQALVERHNYFRRQGEQEKAAADADRIIQLQPESSEGYMARAMTSAAFGDADESMNYAARVLQQNPKSWEGYTIRAAARSEKGDYRGASEDYETALKLSPDNAVVLNTRGLFYLDRGDYEKSLADMERAVELEPQSYVFKAFVADLLATCPDQRFHDAKKANEYATAAFKSAPNDPFVWIAYAAAAAESGNFEEAIKWQQRVNESSMLTAAQKGDSGGRLEAYRANKPYRDNSATLIDNQRKMEEAADAINGGKLSPAIALLSEVIAADPKKARAYTLRGIAHFRLHKHELAIADLNAAIERNPKDADAHFYRARVFYTNRKYARAVDDLQIWETLNSRSSDPLNELAWLYSTCPDDEVRDGGKASEYVDRALEMQSDKPQIWDTCAAVFAENGDFDEAIEWERAYLDRQELSQEQRERGRARLDLYLAHHPYREKPAISPGLASSAPLPTPTPSPK